MRNPEVQDSPTRPSLVYELRCVLPENMAEENLPAVEAVQEYQYDVDVNVVDVGDDAVAVR